MNKQKSVSDYETMAFVGLRDIVQVNSYELAKLYNYNKGEYDTFQAAINNVRYVLYICIFCVTYLNMQQIYRII